MSAWIERKKGFLNRPKRRRPVPEEEIPGSKEETNNEEYGVIYMPAQCPRCFSLKVKCYSTNNECRYYKCQKCGKNFKAVVEYQFKREED